MKVPANSAAMTPVRQALAEIRSLRARLAKAELISPRADRDRWHGHAVSRRRPRRGQLRQRFVVRARRRHRNPAATLAGGCALCAGPRRAGEDDHTAWGIPGRYRILRRGILRYSAEGSREDGFAAASGSGGRLGGSGSMGRLPMGLGGANAGVYLGIANNDYGRAFSRILN